MIVPNYNAFKEGLCTDMEFFRFAYAGKDGTLIKKYVKSLGNKHPFYIIKRHIDPQYGRETCEFKVYDLYRKGYVEREVISEDKEEGILIPSVTAWWEDYSKKPSFKHYVRFCKDMMQF